MKRVKYSILAVLLLVIIGGTIGMYWKGNNHLQEQKDLELEDEKIAGQIEATETDDEAIDFSYITMNASDADIRNTIEKDANTIVCSGISFCVTGFKRLYSISDVQNEILRRKLEDFDGIEEGFEYVLFTVNIKNETDQSVRLNLPSLFPAVLDSENNIDYFDTILLEQDDSMTEMPPGTENSFSMIALQKMGKEELEALLQKGEWYLCVNPCGLEPDIENKNIFFLRLDEEITSGVEE